GGLDALVQSEQFADQEARHLLQAAEVEHDPAGGVILDQLVQLLAHLLDGVDFHDLRLRERHHGDPVRLIDLEPATVKRADHRSSPVTPISPFRNAKGRGASAPRPPLGTIGTSTRLRPVRGSPAGPPGAAAGPTDRPASSWTDQCPGYDTRWRRFRGSG